MNVKDFLILVAVSQFFLVPGYSQDFRLELLNNTVKEGQPIFFNLTVLNPSLSNVSVRQVFLGPENTTIRLAERELSGSTLRSWKTPYNKEGEWTLKVEASGIDFERDRVVKQKLEASFNVTKIYSSGNPKFVIFILSAVTSFFTTLINYFMIDQKRARAIKEKVSEFQKEMIAAQKSGDKKRIAKMRRKQAEMMNLQSEMMKNQMKPMIIYMLPLLGVFYYLQAHYNLIPVVELPFRIGFLQFFHQNNPISPDQFGFIAWYLVSATWFGSVFRKIFGVV